MPIRLSREQQKADTRARLIECAHAVFLRNGFHAATLEEIALQAGVTKGAVYSNFASKAQLFLAVNGTRMEERLRKYQRLRVTETRLDTLVREYMRIIIGDDPNGRWASIVAEASAVAASDEPFRAALIEQSSRGNAVIADAMVDMAERTGVEFRLPRAQMIKVGSALMRGLLLQRLLDPKGVSREFIEDVYVAFIEAMVMQRPRAPRLEGAARKGAGRHDEYLSTPRSGGRAPGRRGA
jgi:AcrR family transcriptional regulator